MSDPILGEVRISGVKHLPAERTLLIFYQIVQPGVWDFLLDKCGYRNVCDDSWTLMIPNTQHPRHTDTPITVGKKGIKGIFAWNYSGIPGIKAEDFDEDHSYLIQLTMMDTKSCKPIGPGDPIFKKKKGVGTFNGPGKKVKDTTFKKSPGAKVGGGVGSPGWPGTPPAPPPPPPGKGGGDPEPPARISPPNPITPGDPYKKSGSNKVGGKGIIGGPDTGLFKSANVLDPDPQPGKNKIISVNSIKLSTFLPKITVKSNITVFVKSAGTIQTTLNRIGSIRSLIPVSVNLHKVFVQIGTIDKRIKTGGFGIIPGGSVGKKKIGFVSILNEHDIDRKQVYYKVSVPFAESLKVTKAQLVNNSTSTYGIDNKATSWRVLEYWPDDIKNDKYVKLALAMFYDDVPRNTIKKLDVMSDVTTVADPFRENAWVTALNGRGKFAIETVDSNNVLYRGEIDIFDSTQGKVLYSGTYERVRYYRVYCTSTDKNAIKYPDTTNNPQYAGKIPASIEGKPRDFLSASFYVTDYQYSPFVKVEFLAGNDYLGSDNPNSESDPTDPNYYPLGNIKFREIRIKFPFAWNSVLNNEAQKAEPFTDKTTGQDGYYIIRRENRQHQVIVRYEKGDGNSPVLSWENGETPHLFDGQVVKVDLRVFLPHDQADSASSAQWKSEFGPVGIRDDFGIASSELWAESNAYSLIGTPFIPKNAVFKAVAKVRAANAASGYYNEQVMVKDTRNHTNKLTFYRYFGPFGLYRDTGPGATTGTPRNHYITKGLYYAIIGENPGVIKEVEGLAKASNLRGFHLHNLDPFNYIDSNNRPGMNFWDAVTFSNRDNRFDGKGYNFGRVLVLARIYKYLSNPKKYIKYKDFHDPYASVRSPYNKQANVLEQAGVVSADIEHMSAIYPYDYWVATGSFWAKEEVAKYARRVIGMMWNYPNNPLGITHKIMATRGEGWCTYALCQGWITSDPDSKDRQNFTRWIKDRFYNVIMPQRDIIYSLHPSRCYVWQGSHDATPWAEAFSYHNFFMVYQHNALWAGYFSVLNTKIESSLTRGVHNYVLEVLYDILYSTNYSFFKYYTSWHFRGYTGNGQSRRRVMRKIIKATGLRYYTLARVRVDGNIIDVPAGKYDQDPNIGMSNYTGTDDGASIFALCPSQRINMYFNSTPSATTYINNLAASNKLPDRLNIVQDSSADVEIFLDNEVMPFNGSDIQIANNIFNNKWLFYLDPKHVGRGNL
jgi:hypothetical protein